MSLENPIGSIRTSINEMAKGMAKKEMLDKPEPRHFESILNLYKQLRDVQPEMLEKMIKLTLDAKKVSDELGPELSNIFIEAQNEVDGMFKDKIRVAMQQLYDTIEDQDAYKNEVFKLIDRVVEEREKVIRNNPQVTSAFAGKEDKLNKVLGFTRGTIRKLFEDVVALED